MWLMGNLSWAYWNFCTYCRSDQTISTCVNEALNSQYYLLLCAASERNFSLSKKKKKTKKDFLILSFYAPVLLLPSSCLLCSPFLLNVWLYDSVQWAFLGGRNTKLSAHVLCQTIWAAKQMQFWEENTTFISVVPYFVSFPMALHDCGKSLLFPYFHDDFIIGGCVVL